MRTIELGVTITDAALDDQVTVVFCDLLTDGPNRCPSCSQAGTYRDTIVRTVTDLPVAGHPLQLRVRVPRYRCENASCEREVFRHNTDRLARPGGSTTRRCARHILRRLMVDRTSVAAIARELGLSWDTVNSIAVEATTALLAADPARLESVRVIGVDEHRWAPTRRAAGDGYVTVIVDLTPVFDGTGPARLLDLVVTVMDPFHVVALAGTKLDLCRQRVQQHTCGHRGRSGDPLYGVRRAARTRQELLSDRQRRRLEAVFAEERHLPFAVTGRIYQDVIDAYADHDRRRGKKRLIRVIDTIRSGVPDGLEELAQLGRTLHRRRADVLAYFEYRASNGPTEAINGRLEALRRHALGFRNLLHYRTGHCCTAAT
ncbi:transposase [Rhodococcus aetherivorans]